MILHRRDINNLGELLRDNFGEIAPRLRLPEEIRIAIHIEVVARSIEGAAFNANRTNSVAGTRVW